MKIAIIGTGLYSTALTYNLQKKKDNDIYLWTESKKTQDLFKRKKKFEFLSKITKFDSNVFVTTNMENVLKDASVIFILVGSENFENILDRIKPYYKRNTPIFVGTKGMNLESNTFFSDITRKHLKCNSYTFFAGPTLAKDIILDYPFALTFAGSNKIGYNLLSKILPEYIKTEFTYDLYGLEMLAVLKNIYAIGSGILKGQHVPNCVYYTYLTEVTKEAIRIMRKMNGLESTIMSYGGIGDFFMTCTNKNSRNFSYGKLIGSKAKKEQRKDYQEKNTIEGLTNLQSCNTFLNKLKIKESIINKIYEIVINEENPKQLFQIEEEKSEMF